MTELNTNWGICKEYQIDKRIQCVLSIAKQVNDEDYTPFLIRDLLPQVYYYVTLWPMNVIDLKINKKSNYI